MKVFLILNGGRAPVPASLVERLEKLLKENGQPYHIAVSNSLKHAEQLVEEAAAGDYDTLWMGGGDGTINVLLNHAIGKGLAFGVVPMGTVNALARSLGIPLNPEAAAKHLLQCSPQPMDVGEVNSRKFLCFASVGFDAAVVHDVTGAFKRRCGRFAYFLAGLRAIFHMGRVVPFEVNLPEDAALVEPGPATCELGPSAVARLAESSVVTGYSFMLSNICNYAGFRMFHAVGPCSGDMEFWLFRKNRLDSMLGWAAASGSQWKRLRRRYSHAVGHYRLSSFTVSSTVPMFLQLDGEAVKVDGDTRYTFRCLPSAAQVLMKS